MLLGFLHALHECSVGHVGFNVLDDKTFWAFLLVLVRALRLHLLLPLTLLLAVDLVTLHDVLRDESDGFCDAVLAGTGSCHQHVHQRGLVFYIVDVFEARFPQVSSQSREHRMCHRWLVDLRCLGDEELDERGKLRRHFGRKRTITTSVCANSVFVFVLVFVEKSRNIKCSLQQFRHRLVLTPVASTLDGVHPLLATFAIRR